MKDSSTQNVNKVPALGDVPLFGNLFKSRRAEKHKTNLIVFIRPTILRTNEDGLKVSSGKYYKIRGEQIKLEQKEVAWMLNEKARMLPEEPSECCEDNKPVEVKSDAVVTPASRFLDDMFLHSGS